MVHAHTQRVVSCLLVNEAVPLLPSGQVPPMYAKAHIMHRPQLLSVCLLEPGFGGGGVRFSGRAGPSQPDHPPARPLACHRTPPTPGSDLDLKGRNQVQMSSDASPGKRVFGGDRRG